jgi:hypothetical protein
MTLDEAITQLIGLGEKDPLEIARKIEARYEPEWLVEQLAAQAESLIAGIARQRLGSIRRSAEVALRPGDAISQAEMRVAKVWVPEVGWKTAADLTVDDLRAKAAWYERLAGAAIARAKWCREVAQMMTDDKVATLRRLKRPLPELPGGRGVEVIGG